MRIATRQRHDGVLRITAEHLPDAQARSPLGRLIPQAIDKIVPRHRVKQPQPSPEAGAGRARQTLACPKINDMQRAAGA